MSLGCIVAGASFYKGISKYRAPIRVMVEYKNVKEFCNRADLSWKIPLNYVYSLQMPQ